VLALAALTPGAHSGAWTVKLEPPARIVFAAGRVRPG